MFSICKFILSITSPRGTGKTFGLLKYIIEHDLRFIYLRRLQKQLDNCVSTAANNPFKAVNAAIGSEITAVRDHGSVEFRRPGADPDQAELETIGYGAALSTVATIRGSDFSDVDVIVFDEFIAMTGERPIKNEVFAFLNFVETVNRNRELQGREPVKVFMLGNANRLMNPYFLEGFGQTGFTESEQRRLIWYNIWINLAFMGEHYTRMYGDEESFRRTRDRMLTHWNQLSDAE